MSQPLRGKNVLHIDFNFFPQQEYLLKGKETGQDCRRDINQNSKDSRKKIMFNFERPILDLLSKKLGGFSIFIDPDSLPGIKKLTGS